MGFVTTTRIGPCPILQLLEYLDGFTELQIQKNSVPLRRPIPPYVHYQLTLPSADMRFLGSAVILCWRCTTIQVKSILPQKILSDGQQFQAT
ncbi:MAG: hypothetical protein IPF46_16095 [Saprospiraceae bacterium]|nr:hypothetical protein [Candidatus Vicinibacter affinis]